jgi:4-alpha-glucanotransferase
VGDYTDLGRAARWVGGLGGGFISTLPLLATFLDAPFEPSPYSPASRLFWNELFIDVTAVPGWTGVDAALARRSRGPRRPPRRLPPDGGAQAPGTRACHGACRGDPAFRRAGTFAAAHPRADDYAGSARSATGAARAGRRGPKRMRDGASGTAITRMEDFDYHLFAQWQADSPARRGRRDGDGAAAALYLDMPLGVNPDGYDSWRFRGIFAEGVSAGAPPDPLFTGGQDWGFAPLYRRRCGPRVTAI